MNQLMVKILKSGTKYCPLLDGNEVTILDNVRYRSRKKHKSVERIMERTKVQKWYTSKSVMYNGRLLRQLLTKVQEVSIEYNFHY